MVVAVVVATAAGLAFVWSLLLNPFFCKKKNNMDLLKTWMHLEKGTK
jgi:hypothetical protein